MSYSMFSDRRSGKDRRQQNLPIPEALDRRQADSKQSRRSRSFQAKPWWLSIQYGEELISEKESLPGEQNIADSSSDQTFTGND